MNATSSTSLNTPGYPNNYAIELDCTWYIDTRVDQILALDFSSDFEVGRTTGSGKECDSTGAYVKVWDNIDVDRELLGQYCGKQSSIPLLSSTGPFVLVEFIAGTVSSKGFKLTVTPGPSPNACGGELTGIEGEISSPGYPLAYDNDMNCVWRIQVGTDNTVRLKSKFYFECHLMSQAR